MSKKKKILVGIGIYLLICGIIFTMNYVSWLKNVDELYLIEFQKSVVLKEKFGEIVKVERGIFEREKVYDENRLTIKYSVYNKDNEKYEIQPIFYKDSKTIPAYLIDGELVYEKEEYQKTTILKSDNAFTDILVKFNGNIYGKSYSVIDYIGNPDGPVGVIDKLTDKENIPKYDGETNTEELLNAIVDASGEEGLVLQYNNDYVLFRRIDY